MLSPDLIFFSDYRRVKFELFYSWCCSLWLFFWGQTGMAPDLTLVTPLLLYNPTYIGQKMYRL